MYILSNCKRCTKIRQDVPKNTRAVQENPCTALVSKEKRSMDEKTWGHVLVPGPCSLPENTYSITADCENKVNEILRKSEKTVTTGKAIYKYRSIV